MQCVPCSSPNQPQHRRAIFFSGFVGVAGSTGGSAATFFTVNVVVDEAVEDRFAGFCCVCGMAIWFELGAKDHRL